MPTANNHYEGWDEPALEAEYSRLTQAWNKAGDQDSKRAIYNTLAQVTRALGWEDQGRH